MVDCSVLCIKRNSNKNAFIKRYKALISGMTDIAHFNDYILLANFKIAKYVQ